MSETKHGAWEMACSGTATDKKNRRRVQVWMATWMGLWLGILMAVKFEWMPQGPLATALVLISAVLGLFALAAYRRFLLEADELRRKIELEALAFAVGTGVLGGMTIWLLVQIGSLANFEEIWLVTAMLVAHALGVHIGQRRYA